MTVIVSWNSVAPEPGLGRSFLWPRLFSLPQSHLPLLGVHFILSWAHTEGAPSLRKILKASANVCKEPQEEGRAVAWIIPNHFASDILIDIGFNALDLPGRG